MELPGEPQIRWILRRTATLVAAGAEPVRGLIVPTAEHFPDRFDGSPQAVAALMARVQEHAGLSDIHVDLAFITPEGEAQVGGCQSGACGSAGKLDVRLSRVTRRDDGSYVVAIGTGEVRHPAVLTTALVRAVSAMFMIEADAYDTLPVSDREAATDLAGVLLGFGVLLSNGSYVYMKGCGSVSVHSATKMPVEETTLALAVFCKLFGKTHGFSDRLAAKHLEVTPRAHFEEAAVWASSNTKLIQLVHDDPNALLEDRFSLSESRSWLARVLGVGDTRKGKQGKQPEDDLAELERALASAQPKQLADPDKRKKLAEIRALVDESLEG